MNNLIIRFKKKGYKNKYVFDVVLVEKHLSVNSSKFIEKLGYYNPHANNCFENKLFLVDVERFVYWISKGVVVNANVKKKLVKFLL